VPGWFEDDDILDDLIRTLTVTSVIEIGALFGRATAYFLSKPQITRVTVVDPFDGAFFWGDRPPKCDRMFSEYRANLEALGHLRSDRLHTYALRSSQVISPPRADLIYLDGSHAYEDVIADLRKYAPLANRVVCGDDYEPLHPGVMQAVDEFYMRGHQLSQRPDSDFWYFVKRSLTTAGNPA
jgi:hypothetical protein